MSVQCTGDREGRFEHRRLKQIRLVFLANAIAGRPPSEQPLDWARQPGGITYWEELGCLRLDASRRRLDIVVLTKGLDGYSAGADLPGTTEYLRLFADWGDGQFSSFGLLELPVANRRVRGARAWGCSRTRMSVEVPRREGGLEPVRLRVVLSWQEVPPADDPEFQPVFGHRCDHQPLATPLLEPWLARGPSDPPGWRSVAAA